MMTGTYNPWLVSLSVLIAVFVSYTALNLVARVITARGVAAKVWLIGGGIVMGTGIWSMHFIGMLAFSLPIELSYHIPTMLLSLLIAIVTSCFAMMVASSQTIGWLRLSAAAAIMGCGVASMHYSGMYAMRIVPAITYEPILFVASLVIAIGASFVALWLAFHLRHPENAPRMAKVGAAVVMGLAIAGMHYTGMAASQFAPNAYCLGVGTTSADDGHAWLGLIVTVSALGLLAVTLMTLVYDSHLESKLREHASKLEEANAQLQHLASHDPLTGVANRTLFEERVSQAIERAARMNRRFAVLLVDLDRFKYINDSFGHQAGDELLRQVAGRLSTLARRIDTVARFGGDEFVLLIDEIDSAADAEAVAVRLLDHFVQPFDLGSNAVGMSPSIGISAYPKDGKDLEALLVRADAAMYQAKSAGRNTFKHFSHELRATDEERRDESDAGLASGVA